MTKKIGIVLAGCGVYDGAEIQEAVAAMLALDQRGATTIAMAPNIEQMHVIDHLAGAPAEGQSRNVMTEASRIVRGEIKDIATVNAEDLDALIFPGGFGAAKNLSDFAVNGAKMSINADVDRLIKAMRQAGKPQGFICIAPALAAKSLGADFGVKLTIGNDAETAAGLEALGAKHEVCAVDEICIDADNRVVSTPAYMLGPSIAQVHKGIDKLVAEVLDLC
jgi:enhancing lycopene biosynthesis protein 2